jgi:hypothetical protein
MATIAQFLDDGHAGYLARNGNLWVVCCTTCQTGPAEFPRVVGKWRQRRNTPPDKAAAVWRRHLKAVTE